MKTAVILLSMGGPESLAGTRRFLFSMFSDPAILRLPALFRLPLAFFLSRAREKKAQSIYAFLGGRSPLLKNTQAQADALERALSARGEYRCFIGMLYAGPSVRDAVEKARAWGATKIVLLPMYPQGSTTTTGAALSCAAKEIKKAGGEQQRAVVSIKPFYDNEGFLDAQTQSAMEKIKEAEKYGPPCVIFSAHGLPKAIVKAGDTYPDACEKTARALQTRLAEKGTDFVLAYQSRVGPMAWTEPFVEDAVLAAARQKKPVLLVPLAFVCENSETLVDLSRDMVAYGTAAGAPWIGVAPTVGTRPPFINALADKIVQEAENIRVNND